jgi:hypothetical protein
MTCPVCARVRSEGWTGLARGVSHCGDSRRAGITGCHVEWTGRSRMHTVCCHRTFSGETAEVRYHREAKTARCRTDAEMAALGAVCRAGVWGGPSHPTAIQSLREADLASTTGPRGGLVGSSSSPSAVPARRSRRRSTVCPLEKVS